MAPAESYARIGPEKIYDRGELVYPDVIMVFHPQVITMQKSYTAPFYSGIKKGGLVIINTDTDLLSAEDHKRLEDDNCVGLQYRRHHSGVGNRQNRAVDEYGDDRCLYGLRLKWLICPQWRPPCRIGSAKSTLRPVVPRLSMEAIKKKYAKKEQLLQANNDAIKRAYAMSDEWVQTSSYSPVYYETAVKFEGWL